MWCKNQEPWCSVPRNQEPWYPVPRKQEPWCSVPEVATVHKDARGRYRCQDYGHRQLECPTKVSPGKDQKISTPVSQCNQKKTRAMVAMSHEDGEEAFTCVNEERPKTCGNSKKSSWNRLTSSVEAIYSAACSAQSNDGQIYFGLDRLIGRPVKG